MMDSTHLYEIFRLSPLPVIVVRPEPPDFFIIFANEAFHRLFNHSNITAYDNGRPGKHFFRQHHTLGASFSSALETKTTVSCDYPFQTGSYTENPLDHLVQAVTIPLLSPSGEVECIVHQVIASKEAGDKDLQQTIQQLEQLNSTLTATLESIHDGFYTLDHNWCITYWNQAAEHLLGINAEDVVGSNFWERFGKPSGERVAHSFRKAYNEKIPVRFEDFYPNSNRWYEMNAYPSDVGLSIFFRDVTVKKNTELDLIKFKMIIENSKDGIALADQKGKRLYWNPAFQQIIGDGRDPGPDPRALDPVYVDKAQEDAVFSTLLGGEYWKGEVELYDSERKIIPFHLSGGPVFNERGQLIAIYGIHTDISEWKEASERLKASFEEKNVILESIGDAFFAVNKKGIVNYWNRQAEVLFRQPREKILNRELWDVFEDLIGSNFYIIYHKALSENQIVRSEEYLKPLGLWLEISAYPSRGGMSVYMTDITSKKNATERMYDSEEKNRLIMNAALDAIICIDAEGNVTFWNPQAEAIFGWKAEEVMGGKLSSFIIPECHRHHHDEGMRRYLETREERALNRLLELQGVRRNGDQISIELTVIPIKQSNHEFFCAFVRDISARKKAEDMVRLSNERFEKVSQATNDAIWDWDITQNSIYRGPGFDKIFRKNVQKPWGIETFWKETFHPADLPKIRKSITDALAEPGNSRWELEYRILEQDDRIITVADRGIIIRDESGKAVRMVGAMTDITYRKEYEESLKLLNASLAKHSRELALSNQELEQFAYVASHDLQEPLRMVTSFLTQLEKRYSDLLDDKGKQYIFFAVDGARRMRQIILDLLEFSRVGKWSDEVQNTDVYQVVQDVVVLFAKQVEESGAVIHVGDLPSIRSHRTPLRQIFQNLIGNALKYKREGVPPEIYVSCSNSSQDLTFSVIDNGIGIDKEYHDKIFILFQRLHKRDEYSGTGIGLAIVKKIITNLGGKIWVESNPHHGTSFYFTLPKTVLL